MAAINDLIDTLKRLQIETRFDLPTRILYSTDASIYQIEPLGVAFPRHLDELGTIVEIAGRYDIPLLARGAGSSLAGQAIGAALILDCSRYLTRILDINAEERTAIVEPGVILNSLNKSAAQYHLQFGPDPASAERATMGGSIANNATGAHSILYGMAADHILSADVVLSDASLVTFEEKRFEQVKSLAQGKGIEAGFYRAALQIREHHAGEIQTRWPRTWRRAAGYNLNYLLPWSPASPPGWGIQFESNYPAQPYPPISPDSINLSQLLAGSEGTLAIIRQAKVRLVPLQQHTILAVLAFDDISEACDAAPAILDLGPSAIELIPGMLIDLARSVPAFASQLSLLDELDSKNKTSPDILAVEFSGDAPSVLSAAINRLKGELGQTIPIIVAETLEAQKQVWAVRKVGLGLLSSRPGNIKSTAFIEDLSVPVENLGVFVRELQHIFSSFGTRADFYAHASAGCLHIRPMVDLKSLAGVKKLREIAREAVALTLRYGGAVSGEHGIGLARSEWLGIMYGSQVLEASRLLKKAADPKRLFNPNKLFDAPGMDENLRFGAGYQASPWSTALDFTRIGGLDGAIEMCNGAGVCRKMDGVMCPSFQATAEEMHSTRGRANLLRALISRPITGQESPRISEAVYEALDLCLACKGCKAECPSAVDMAKLKYEYLHHYYNSHPRKIRDYLFAYIGPLAHAGHLLAMPVNYLLQQRWVKRLAERWIGLATQRQFPSLRWDNLNLQMMKETDGIVTSQEWRSCLLLSDPFTEYFHPEVGSAAIHVLSKLGYKVHRLPVIGAARTLLSKGFIPQARRHTARLIEVIEGMDPENKLPVIGIEPSEIYTLRDEFFDLLPNDPRLRRIADRAWMVDEFLVRPDQSGKTLIEMLGLSQPAPPHNVYLHGHCYQKAQPPNPDGYPVGVPASHRLLASCGYKVTLLDSGCCGMAGAFGYEAEHYALSIRVGELALFPSIRSAIGQEGGIVAAAGVSCQAQIEDGTGQKALHPIQLVDRLLG